MNFHIMTLFPDMVNAVLNTSIIGRAVKAGLISINTVNFRDYTDEKHGHVDDAPFGGGAGMVIMCQPVYDAWKDVCAQIGQPEAAENSETETRNSETDAGNSETSAGCSGNGTGTGQPGRKVRVIYTSPAGKIFDQDMAKELAQEEDLIILCGHYEGVDQRVLDLMEAEEVSIGDYVLTGGELPAMVMVDAVSRMVPGVLTNSLSGEEESFSRVCPEKEFTKKIRREVYGDLLNRHETELKLLEYPQYTRPEEFMGLKVPEVLLSGDHARVDAWRRQQSVKRTRQRRPDLLS